MRKLPNTGTLTALAALIALAAACSRLGDPAATYDWSNFCTNCHGGLDNPTGAPPPDTRGTTETTARSVGAHTICVFYSGLSCDACHKKVYSPETALSDPEHLDGPPPEIFFGPNSLASHDGAEPSYDPATLTCSNLYCHGATLQGGTYKTPVWNRVGQGQTACGTCHEPGWIEPPAEADSADVAGQRVHVLHTLDLRGPRLACTACHPDTSGATHIDGVLELNDGADGLEDTGLCADCHGGAAAAAKSYWSQPRDAWRQAGEVAYCLNCHSSEGSYEDGEEPPEVGDDYETGGHGHDGVFPATQHGLNGPGFACSVCHDPNSPHLAESDPEHRLRIDNIGGQLCLDCHGTEGDQTLGSAQTKLSSHTSSITDRHPGVPQYNYTCADCHDPHGTSNLAMIRTTIDGRFGVQTTVQFTGEDLTGLDPTTDPDDGVCDACHGAGEQSHLATNHPANHNQGMNCMICHRHDRSFWF